MPANSLPGTGAAAERWCKLPIGWFHLRASEAGLVSASLAAAGAGLPPGKRCGHGPNPRAEAVLDLAERELKAYFRGALRAFSVPLDLTGMTPFRQSVLNACRKVPYGETLGYGQLGHRAGYPGSARAVGQAMARNPLALVVPCHRVVGHDGSLTGYGGGLELKKHLLALERGIGERGAKGVCGQPGKRRQTRQ